MEKTKSFTYVLPMLSNILAFKDQIANVYLADEAYPDLKGIFVLYKFSGSPKYLEYEDKIQSNPLFKKMYEPDTKHTMMVFDAPPTSKLDFFRFKSSLYSQMSDPYKKRILAYHGVGKEHILYHILYKTEEAFEVLEQQVGQSVPRQNQATSIVNMEKETYREEFNHKPIVSPNKDFIKQ